MKEDEKYGCFKCIKVSTCKCPHKFSDTCDFSCALQHMKPVEFKRKAE